MDARTHMIYVRSAMDGQIFGVALNVSATPEGQAQHLWIQEVPIRTLCTHEYQRELAGVRGVGASLRVRYTVQYCVGGSALPRLRRDGAHPFPHLRRDRLAVQCADGCLFDVSADPAEHADLAADQAHAARSAWAARHQP
jgi:hypothetical protein